MRSSVRLPRKIIRLGSACTATLVASCCGPSTGRHTDTACRPTCGPGCVAPDRRARSSDSYLRWQTERKKCIDGSAEATMSAVMAQAGPDSGVAWHYGDPMREQRLLD